MDTNFKNRESVKVAFVLILFVLVIVFAHPSGLDDQGGHFNRKTNTYHCHEEPCFSIHKQVEEATQEAEPGTYSRVYNRDDWPHWIDSDNDCQNMRQELLIATSMIEVQFTDSRRCTVKTGHWYGVYTGQIFTKASDVDIDHIVPLAHARRHGADNWTRDQRREFANDPDNLLVVDDGTNQSKSDQAPHEWLPPNEDYWCEYGKRWEHVKEKYNLLYSESEHERITLS